MRTNQKVEVRRCRPLLGTFVEIRAFGGNTAELEGAVDTAFLAIAQVHRLMSFHDPKSEVSRLNREAYYKPVRVHPWTWCVLKSAQEFSGNTDGIFDITMASRLVKWNYLPTYRPRSRRAAGAISFLKPSIMSDFAVRYRLILAESLRDSRSIARLELRNATMSRLEW